MKKIKITDSEEDTVSLEEIVKALGAKVVGSLTENKDTGLELYLHEEEKTVTDGLHDEEPSE